MATRDLNASNYDAARALRKKLTVTEELLWDQLRNRRLDGLKFRRQHPVGRFVLDFYCVEAQLAVEVDGGVHSTHEQSVLDADRQSDLEARGIRFVRVSSSAVEQAMALVLEQIASACHATPPLHASGEGVGG